MTALLTSSGCSNNTTTWDAGAIVRPAMDQPTLFMVDSSAGPVRPDGTGGCRNPLVDPRDGTRLTLIRSAKGLGDYEAGVGRYGLREGELLRIDCATGRAIGIVKR